MQKWTYIKFHVQEKIILALLVITIMNVLTPAILVAFFLDAAVCEDDQTMALVRIACNTIV